MIEEGSIEHTSGQKKDLRSPIWLTQVAENPDKDFYFIIGSDLNASMHTWNEFPLLKKEVRCILVNRKGYVCSSLSADKLPWVVYCIQHTNSCFITYSSTEARCLLKKENKKEEDYDRLKQLFVSEVLEYIKANGLYGSVE